MKKSKRFLSLLTAAALVLSSAAAFAAEDEIKASKTATQEIVTLDEALKDEANWSPADEITFEDGSVTHQFKNVNVLGYSGQTFTDELIEFKGSFPFQAWCGMLLRAENTTNVSYQDNPSYLVVFKNDIIELQRFATNDHVFLQIVDNVKKDADGNPIMKDGQPVQIVPENTEVLVQFGAINVGEGVQLILNIDGYPVFNVYDDAPLAKNLQRGGYLAFQNPANMTISSVGDTENPVLPPAAIGVTVSGEPKVGETLTIDYTYLDYNGGTESGTEVQWYSSPYKYGDLDVTGMTDAQADELELSGVVGKYDKIEGATGLSYTITEADRDKYIKAVITPKSDKETPAALSVTTKKFFVDTLEERLSSGIFMVIENEMAYVDGERKQIDPNDRYIVPFVAEGDRTLVPLRFLGESLGGEVGWFPERGDEITIDLGDNNITMHLNSNVMTVNGEERTLDVAAQSVYGRTMVPLRAIAEAFGKQVFYDPKGLIVISDTENILDSTNDAAVIDRIITAVKKGLE